MGPFQFDPLRMMRLEFSVTAKPNGKTWMRRSVPDQRARGLMIADEDFGARVGGAAVLAGVRRGADEVDEQPDRDGRGQKDRQGD